MFISLANDTELGGPGNTLEEKEKIEKYLGGLEQWNEMNRMYNFILRRKVLHVGWKMKGIEWDT